jgi:hypothetical protein
LPLLEQRCQAGWLFLFYFETKGELMVIDLEDLEPVLERVVAKALAASARQQERLAYLEPEAAQLMGVKSHVLRDARRFGQIRHTKVGGRIAYTKQQLQDYLEAQSV